MNDSPLHEPNTIPAPLTGLEPQAVADTARQAWDTTKEKAGEALESGEKYVRENPATSALGIFGVGFVLGLLVGWSIAHEDRDSYTSRASAFGKRWAGKMNWD